MRYNMKYELEKVMTYILLLSILSLVTNYKNQVLLMSDTLAISVK